MPIRRWSTISAASSTNRSTRPPTTAPRSSRPRPASATSIRAQNEAQREQALRSFAEQGYNPIVVAGFAQARRSENVAKEFPDTKFVIVDMVVDLPNVRSMVFKEHEGSYLVGILAAMASKTGKVGFVGGMDIPLIRKFACGYVQGVKAAKPDTKVFQNMTGDHRRCLERSGQGGELAKAQIDQGADVVYARRRRHRASACCRRPPTPASSASASTPTRTTCIPARC